MSSKIKPQSREELISSAKQIIQNIEVKETKESLADRVCVLTNRIFDLPGFSISEFRRITKLGDQTIRTWKDKGVDRPHDSTLNAVRKYLRIAEAPFKDYIDGRISIDELWESRNTEVVNKVTVDSLVNSFRVLELTDKLEVLSKLPDVVRSEIEILLKEDEPEPEIELVELSNNAWERLRELLKMSLLFQKKTEEDLIDSDVDGALLESIVDGTKDKYSKEAYLSLTPFLFRVIQWSAGIPVINPNSKYNDDLDSLIEELEQN